MVKVVIQKIILIICNLLTINVIISFDGNPLIKSPHKNSKIKPIRLEIIKLLNILVSMFLTFFLTKNIKAIILT